MQSLKGAALFNFKGQREGENDYETTHKKRKIFTEKNLVIKLAVHTYIYTYIYSALH